MLCVPVPGLRSGPPLPRPLMLGLPLLRPPWPLLLLLEAMAGSWRGVLDMFASASDPSPSG